MLSYALTTTQSLNWIVRSATEVETNIVSVERVQEYIELKPEAALSIPETQPGSDWPQSGSLTFKHVSARYRADLDLVVKDVSFDIKGGEVSFSRLYSIVTAYRLVFLLFRKLVSVDVQELESLH